MNIEDYILDALDKVSAWDLPDEEPMGAQLTVSTGPPSRPQSMMSPRCLLVRKNGLETTVTLITESRRYRLK